MSTVLSLYIPIINENISEEYIKTMFKSHDIGNVMRVDFVYNKNKKRREAFIHFDEWFNNEKANKLQEDVKDKEKNVKFTYAKNKFWPLLPNRNAHKRVDNPNYQILKPEDIKNEIKTMLNDAIMCAIKSEETNIQKRRKSVSFDKNTIKA